MQASEPPRPNETVYTIGHSNHDIEQFLALLKQYDINCLIDVRSAPYSRFAPHYNKRPLRASLQEQNLIYMHFDKEFGARQTKPSLLDETGKVDFDKVRATETFKQGVERLRKGLDLGYTIVLMCSEGDPFDCHRFSMISCQLVKEGLAVKHILPNGTLIDNSDLEAQLLEKYRKKLPQSNLFETVTPEMQLEAAYRLRGKHVAYAAEKATSADSQT